MKRVRTGIFVLLLLGLGSAAGHGSSVLPLTLEQRIERAGAICRGTVVQVQCYRDATDGLIYTRTLVRVDESLKGRFPAVVQLVHRGGVVDDEGDENGFAPQLRVGDERLFFLSRRPNGTLGVMQGGVGAFRLRPNDPRLRRIRQRAAAGVDVTDQAAEVVAASSSMPITSLATSSVTGMLTDTNGIASRFLACDQGDAIPYLIDADTLPAGITLTQATNAVHNAFQAWAAVTSLKFVFDGLQSFGQSADTVVVSDGRIRIQLHNLYGTITDSTVLGIGGRSYTFNNTLFPGGGYGGRVWSNEFHRTTRGYVVLNHTATAMQTLSTFEEVLCHEIGHTLSLAHSSEDPSEPDTVLKQAIMYFLVHADGRGATLGSWDPPVVQQAYPPGNTPPYGYDRVIYAVTSSTVLAHPEVNQVEMKGYDLQNTTLSKTMTNSAGSVGTFSFNGDSLVFTPSGLISGTPVDPAGNSYFVRTYVRYDDGTNASPYVLTRVIALLPDTEPSGAPDGLPDGWRAIHFGNATPIPGVSGADDDPDGDGMTNLREFQSDTDPQDGNSCLHITGYDALTLHWQARPYELYEVQTSTNLSTWARVGNPLIISNQTGSATGGVGSSPSQFYRIRKIP